MNNLADYGWKVVRAERHGFGWEVEINVDFYSGELGVFRGAGKTLADASNQAWEAFADHVGSPPLQT